MAADRNTFGTRVKRYVGVGQAVGGVALRAAGARAMGKSVLESIDAEHLRHALGTLKGPLMKIAQILGTIPDLLPAELTRELSQLQNNAPPMGRAFMQRRMKGQLGTDWEARFRSFDHKAAAAASLGQVHRAVHTDGRTLACKLQYPNMEAAIEADLKQLSFIIALYRKYDQAIDPSNIQQELAERLREELDYVREARHMRLYADMLSHLDDVHIPEPVADLSTERLLTMTWSEGVPLLTLKDAPLTVRNALALTMFRAWYTPFYGYGIIHGDPHPGNYSVRVHEGADTVLNLLDFGCIRVFHAPFVGGVIDLYHALQDNDMARAVHAYETWGFENLTHELIEILNMWARFLYGPILDDSVRNIQHDGGVMYGAEVASKVHEELKRLGGVAPPREFVLMDRAAIGLGSVFTHLGAEINWHQQFHALVGNFNEADLHARQQSVLLAHGLL